MFYHFCQSLPIKNTERKLFLYVLIKSILWGLVGYLLWFLLKSMIADFNYTNWKINFIAFPTVASYIHSIYYLFTKEN